MGGFEFYVWVCALFPAILLGWGQTMISPPHDDFVGARVCFYMSAIILWSFAVAWGWQSDMNWLPRFIIIGSLSAGSGIGLSVVLRKVTLRESATASTATTTNALKPTAVDQQPISFRDLFDRDFVGLGAIAKVLDLKNPPDTSSIQIPVRLLFDYVSRTTTLAVFVEDSAESNRVYDVLLNNRPRIIELMNTSVVRIEIPGDTSVISTDKFNFSNSVYFYTAKDLSPQQQVSLQDRFQVQGVTANFRGRAYYVINWHQPVVSRTVSIPGSSQIP